MAKCSPGCTCGRHTRKDHGAVRGEKEYLCPRCNKWVPESGWYVRANGSRQSYCKPCHTAEGRDRRLRDLFNINEDEYDHILEYQQGVCFICKQPPKKRKLAVDHEHKTGLVRGLLCWGCNAALGKLKDDIELLQNAAAYLARPPAVVVLGEERYGVKGRVTNKRRKRRRLRKK